MKMGSIIVIPLMKNGCRLSYKDDKNPQVQALAKTISYSIRYWHVLGKNLCNYMAVIEVEMIVHLLIVTQILS